MAHFYGRLQGNRGEATRCGSKDSGIDATAESWSTILRVKQIHTGGSDIGIVDFTTKHGNPLFRATFDAKRVAYWADKVPAVKEALENVSEAFRALDRAAADAQNEHDYAESV